MANENIDIITLENIELFQNGERANATNLNRPIVQLRDNQIDQNLMLAQIYNVLSSNNLNLDELQEIVDGLTSKADKVDTYNKTEVDNELILKADKLDTYNKTEIDTELDLKADKVDTYNKTEVDNLTSTWSNIFTAVGGETIVSIPDNKEYIIGNGELIVAIEGIIQILGIDYVEDSNTTVEFTSVLMEGEHIMFQKV